ncbi:hypothetical protein [Corynebacterium qintianiae]|uniref:hypothetical protein n=1 Tax=Corynebacterium qintianiae TaxID=2709392 RepID=UPI0013ECEA65|nr:hypothetical protein [Corynebacterium qintianiae]
MRLIHCQCGGGTALTDAPLALSLPPIPSRADLRPLDDLAAELLPHDDTPSLDEIQASPSVPHMAEPQFAPQRPLERLRIVVSGTDAALGAVLTRMMRGDYLWAEVAYLPADPSSPAALLWGDPTPEEAAAEPVVPSPCIRNDFGQVVAGSATLSNIDPAAEFVGEIVVDSAVLALRTGEEPSATFFGTFGAKLVPTPTAPGIAATPLVTPLVTSGRASRRSAEELERLRGLPGGRWLTRNAGVPAGQTDGSRVLTGRALQAGGRDILLTVDGVARQRAVEKATFYRHLRDIQSVKIGR